MRRGWVSRAAQFHRLSFGKRRPDLAVVVTFTLHKTKMAEQYLTSIFFSVSEAVVVFRLVFVYKSVGRSMLANWSSHGDAAILFRDDVAADEIRELLRLTRITRIAVIRR